MVEGGGFEPPKAEPSDLQSDPFGRSGTPPKSRSCASSLRYPCSARSPARPWRAGRSPLSRLTLPRSKAGARGNKGPLDLCLFPPHPCARGIRTLSRCYPCFATKSSLAGRSPLSRLTLPRPIQHRKRRILLEHSTPCQQMSLIFAVNLSSCAHIARQKSGPIPREEGWIAPQFTPDDTNYKL